MKSSYLASVQNRKKNHRKSTNTFWLTNTEIEALTKPVRKDLVFFFLTQGIRRKTKKTNQKWENAQKNLLENQHEITFLFSDRLGKPLISKMFVEYFFTINLHWYYCIVENESLGRFRPVSTRKIDIKPFSKKKKKPILLRAHAFFIKYRLITPP